MGASTRGLGTDPTPSTAAWAGAQRPPFRTGTRAERKTDAHTQFVGSLEGKLVVEHFLSLSCGSFLKEKRSCR